MGIKEREIIVHGYEPPEPIITLDLVDTLKPAGQAFPDQTPLWMVKDFSLTGFLTRRERNKLFSGMEDRELKAVQAWESAVSGLTGTQRIQVSSSITAVLNNYRFSSNLPEYILTVGTIRYLEVEQLQAIHAIGTLRAAFLKEIFGRGDLDLEEEASLPVVSYPPEFPS
jgi:hypothetical protein